MRERAERIASLDILRGVALFGMLIVHFCALGIRGDEEDGLSRFVSLFLENRFFTMFAMLFGVSFAVQLQRAATRGRPLAPAYVRRLAALGVFGLVAEIGLGYRVLLPYAISGLPLLAVRRWSARALFVLAIGVALAPPAYEIGRTALSEIRNGHTFARAELTTRASAERDHFGHYLRGKRSPEWQVVIATRVDHLRWFFTRPLPLVSYALPCFLLGIAAFRRGIFDQPTSQHRLIVVATGFGVLSWIVAEWVFPTLIEPGPLDTAASATRWVAQASRALDSESLLRTGWHSRTAVGSCS